MVQQLQVEQLSMQEQETKIKRDKIAALETEIETLIEDEAKMRTFVSLPGMTYFIYPILYTYILSYTFLFIVCY